VFGKHEPSPSKFKPQYYKKKKKKKNLGEAFYWLNVATPHNSTSLADRVRTASLYSQERGVAKVIAPITTVLHANERLFAPITAQFFK
jgi:hypothetical protein